MAFQYNCQKICYQHFFGVKIIGSEFLGVRIIGRYNLLGFKQKLGSVFFGIKHLCGFRTFLDQNIFVCKIFRGGLKFSWVRKLFRKKDRIRDLQNLVAF